MEDEADWVGGAEGWRDAGPFAEGPEEATAAVDCVRSAAVIADMPEQQSLEAPAEKSLVESILYAVERLFKDAADSAQYTGDYMTKSNPTVADARESSA